MFAEIEPMFGMIRVWEDGKKYGDPYVWAATIRWISKYDIEIMGHTTHITPSIYKCLCFECKRCNVKRILKVTYDNGKRIEKWTVLNKRWMTK